MAAESKNGLLETAERIGIPIVAISYVLAFAVNVREYGTKLGWRAVSLLVCAVCVSWCLYVWLARRPNELDRSHSVRRFGLSARVGATAAAIASAFPLLYIVVVRYPAPLVPFLMVNISNSSKTPVTIAEYGEFFLTEVETPLADRLVRSGRVKFQSAERPDTFTIEPGNSHVYGGRFQNERVLVPLLARGDLKLAVILLTQDGRSLTMHDMAFASDGYANTFFEINLE